MSEITLDPRLESILHDIASDPKAHLLRPDPAAFAKASSALLDPPTAMQAGLTAAERELVRAYRDEVGGLLRSMAAAAVAGQEGGLIHFTLAPDTWRADESRYQELIQRLLTLTRSAEGPGMDFVDPKALPLERSGLSAQDAMRLACAAYRIRPSAETRVVLAQAQCLMSQYITATRTLDAVLALPSGADLRSIAWQVRATADLFIAGRRAVLNGYLRACECGPHHLLPHAAALLFSLQEGDREAADRIAAILDADFDPAGSLLNDYVHWQGSLREAGDWEPTPAAQQLVSRIERYRGESVAKIVQLVA